MVRASASPPLRPGAPTWAAAPRPPRRPSRSPRGRTTTASGCDCDCGGAGGEPGSGIAVGAAGTAHVTGPTASTEATFPVAVGPDLTFNGSSDAFVAKVGTATATTTTTSTTSTST